MNITKSVVLEYPWIGRLEDHDGSITELVAVTIKELLVSSKFEDALDNIIASNYTDLKSYEESIEMCSCMSEHCHTCRASFAQESQLYDLTVSILLATEMQVVNAINPQERYSCNTGLLHVVAVPMTKTTFVTHLIEMKNKDIADFFMADIVRRNSRRQKSLPPVGNGLLNIPRSPL